MEKFYNGVERKNTSSFKWDRYKNEDKERVLPFWIADSDYPTCQCIIDDLIERINKQTFGYTFIDDEYLTLVKNWVFDRYGYSIEKDWIVTTPGVVTALYMFVNIFTNEKDKVVVSTPVYNPFFAVITNNKRELVCNKLKETNNTYTYDFEDLEDKLKDAKMYILCNPHNPIGRCWSRDEVEHIVMLCKKYDVFLVSDEIHCDIILDDVKHISVGNYLNVYDKIGICTAPSKTFNIAGLMDSNIIIKNSLYRDMFYKRFREMSISEPNIMGICACKSAYKKGHEWVDLQNKYLRENRDIVSDYFQKNIPNAKVYHLEGTYLMWINLSYLHMEQDDLINGLFKEGIQVNSGTTYSSDYIGYIRLNIACGRKQLLEGLERIKRFVLTIRR